MGQQFLRKQAHGFKHRHDAGFNRLQIPNLISSTKPEVMVLEIRCEGSAQTSGPEPGTEVMLHENCGTIAVLEANRVIGAVDASEVPALVPALQIGCGYLRAEVRRKSRVSGSFVVSLQAVP